MAELGVFPFHYQMESVSHILPFSMSQAYTQDIIFKNNSDYYLDYCTLIS